MWLRWGLWPDLSRSVERRWHQSTAQCEKRSVPDEYHNEIELSAQRAGESDSETTFEIITRRECWLGRIVDAQCSPRWP